MPARVTDRENQELVRRAIAEARAATGEGGAEDAGFVERLRAIYFARHPALRRQLPTVRGARADVRAAANDAGGGGKAVADPSGTIYADPRFQRNARALAERAAKRQRVIGGSRVLGTDYADCVAVGNDTQFGCTGTLVAPTLVLTAGHCRMFATRVFFGNDVQGKGKTVGVKRAERHPEYHRTSNHDVMVLVLEKRVAVQPRPLASAAHIDAATEGRVVGFGNTDAGASTGYGVKRKVDVPIASVDCNGSVAGESDEMAYGCDIGFELVAGKSLLAKDSCTGDSGGPFYISDGDGDWLLAGATSRSSKSAMSSCGDGGIYARVDKYREWIEEVGKVKLTVRE